MDQQKTGKFIAQARKQQGLTQAQLAERLGCSDKSVSRWETGRTMPDVSLFDPLCNALGITVEELLQGQSASAQPTPPTKGSRRKTGWRIAIVGVIVLMMGSAMIPALNKTFLKTVYRSDLCENVQIAIPRFCFYRGTNGIDLHTAKLKTLRQPDEVDVFIRPYLAHFKKIPVGDTVYYYNEAKDYTILRYDINNDGIGFINTIYITYHDGYFCEEQ